MNSKYPAPEWVHFSNLKNMSMSPAHYLASLNWGKQTSAMLLGTLTHALVLGGEEYVVFEGKVRRGKAWDEFEAVHQGKLMVSASELEKASRMADSIMRIDDAVKALTGSHEKEIEWVGLAGRKCAGRVDSVGDTFVTDLKTTKCAKPEWFTGESLRRKYHAQVAWYLDGIGGGRKDALIVAVENTAPYVTQVFQLTQRALDDGRKFLHLWMEQLLSCEAANEWPGYCQSVVQLDVPEELEMQFDEEEKEEEE